MHPVVPRLNGLCYGGDYNPEQWPEQVWAEDMALMREAGVNLVSVGIFAWAWLESGEGRYTFDWLDRVLDLLAANDIAADLATATASPPPWFSHTYPQTLPVDADGRTLTYGSRRAYCPSSPVYRDAAVRLVEQLATRYADHPALALWHINNEYGCHFARCYCDTSAAAFRAWLQQRYGDLEGLNHAWGTAFWSQRYTAWEQVLPPRATPSFPNPTQALDFQRFSSDEHLACFRAEREVLRRLTPNIPLTTNMMAGNGFWELDYWAWGPEMDLVSNDHYLRAEEPENQANLAFAADLTRSVGGGAPWLLMEHSTSAVNWQPRNIAKTPGQLRRNSLAHVARGADGAMFFQWRQSAAGAEKFHSAMVPHAGRRTKVWREVVRLGGDLRQLAEVKGSTVEADVAILLDWSSLWAQAHACQPSVDMTVAEEIEAWHRTLWRAGITSDLRPPDADLSGYRLVLAPSLYLISDDAAKSLAGYAESGGTLVVGPYSGIVDPNDHVRLGGYPGAFTDLLGVRIEEFFPLRSGDTVRLDDGSTGLIWSEQGEATTAEVTARYDNGAPAITRNSHGSGDAWYLTTRLDEPSRERFLARVAAEAGVVGSQTPPGVETVRRRHPDTGAAYHFVINHTEAGAEVAAHGTDLLSGNTVSGVLRLPAGGVAVIRENGEA
ncbi:MAG: beta-galactosidase [Micromonosporaceae bacterium]